ncbi:carbamate kinase [Aquidulcibacter sp.]|uniref:amino acid kinase family protein n=1 Tax=Aquidulcibacter sp. TaxID=2052990 RepID=UPI0025C47614|nr:carbamate kinase [Aquidulcibacter sp.]MCA3695327.1 carbamate kinase [Aquidulcibacter sp.]
MTLASGSTLVIALGGNALLSARQPATGGSQRANIANVAAIIAPLLAHYRIVITHGNGPQVGLLAAQTPDADWPLDVLGAESEGMIGYVIEQELANRAPKQLFATLLSQVIVDPNDLAFQHPTKPIGLIHQDRSRLTSLGWDSVEVAAGGWRRVVASPPPLRIVGLETLQVLLAAKVTIICLGGGGIPVGLHGDGRLEGVEAVIDKDLASSLLARDLDADALIMLTNVDGIMARFGTPEASLIRRTTPNLLAAQAFQAGTMAPKVAAAAAMARGGKIAMIGALGDLQGLIDGTKGTWVLPDGSLV